MHDTFLAGWSNISTDWWHKGLQCLRGHSQCHSDQRSKNPGFTGVLYSSLCFNFIGVYSHKKKNWSNFLNSRKTKTKTCRQYKERIEYHVLPLFIHFFYNIQPVLTYFPLQNIKCINRLYKKSNLKYWSFTAWCEKLKWASCYVHIFYLTIKRSLNEDSFITYSLCGTLHGNLLQNLKLKQTLFGRVLPIWEMLWSKNLEAKSFF